MSDSDRIAALEAEVRRLREAIDDKPDLADVQGEIESILASRETTERIQRGLEELNRQIRRAAGE